MRCIARSFLFLIPTISAPRLLAESLTQPSGVRIELSSAGDFTIQSGKPAWIYGGQIQGRVTGIVGLVRGSDDNRISTNGPFDEFTVNYSDADGNPWRMQLRAYRQIPSVTISFTNQSTMLNLHPYSVLTRFPRTAHHFSTGGWTRAFGLLGNMIADSPWLFFDDQFRSSILSPASRPISQRQRWNEDGTGDGVIDLEVDHSNPVLPAGGVYTHLITFDQGIDQTFITWGSTLTNLFGKHRGNSQSDLSLAMPMLSTDAGASYYYKFESALGYEGTLRTAIASANAVRIPIGVVHFDSWWQLKGGNCNAPENASYASWRNHANGAWKYVMDPALFPPINPDNLEDGFVQNLGPGMAHARWVDPCSPYRLPIVDRFGDVLVAQPVSGSVLTDLGIWRRVAHTLKQSGMIIFEPDFLASRATARNTFDDETSLEAMAIAMGEKDIALQYCGPAARHLLLAFKYEGVHTIRVSADRFGWTRWDAELYGSMILKAGSVWPTVDNFQTTEKRNLLLAVLSAGPLALGDPIGAFVPIDDAIRSDGLILKPDVPMVPSDSSFVAEASSIERAANVSVGRSVAARTASVDQPVLPPLVAHTHSGFGSSRVEYVFAYSRALNTAARVIFSPREFGFTGDVYVYDYFNRAGRRQPAAQKIETSVDSQGSYFVIAPVGLSQIAFLGDLSKLVPASSVRMPALLDNGQITLALRFESGETVSLWISAPSAPSASADGATISAVKFDTGTGLYQITVSAGQSERAIVRISPGPTQ